MWGLHRRSAIRRSAITVAAAGLTVLPVLAACSAEVTARSSAATTPSRPPTSPSPDSGSPTSPSPTAPSSSAASRPKSAGPTPPGAGGTPSRPPTVSRSADPFDSATALAGIRTLAAIGPRDAASPAYARAARWTTEQLRAAGYRVRQQPFSLPAGVSWGVSVPAGRPVNVIADPPGFDASKPHVVVGAHLDTVPQSPGAEDNASGVTTMIQLARMAGEQPGAVPVRFVAFAAEEARGGQGRRYAFGSRHFVASLTPAGRRAVLGMVALDRVGVRASTVPVCSGGRGAEALARHIRAAAADAGVPTNACTNRASDHVSFEAVGIPAARLGSVPYAGYHSSRDVPSVVDRRQLERVGMVLWAWLRSLR